MLIRLASQSAKVLSGLQRSCKTQTVRNVVRRYADSSPKNLQAAAVAAAAKAEPFLSGTSSVYVEEMYESWLEDPSSVHKVSHKN